MATLDEVKDLLTNLSNDFKEHRAHMKTSLDEVTTKIDDIKTRLTANEKIISEHNIKIHVNIDDIKTNKFEISELSNTIKQLEKDNEMLANSLDEQIDRNMRETLIFSGIGGTEKTWDETKKTLAKTLESLEKKKVTNADDRYTRQDFSYAIVRAHRGGKGKKNENNVYAKFNSQELVDHIKTLAFADKNIFINQMHSPKVNERLYKGRQLIKTLKASAASKTWKLYMNDRCQLMCKKPGEERYIVYKQF